MTLEFQLRALASQTKVTLIVGGILVRGIITNAAGFYRDGQRPQNVDDFVYLELATTGDGAEGLFCCPIVAVQGLIVHPQLPLLFESGAQTTGTDTY